MQWSEVVDENGGEGRRCEADAPASASSKWSSDDVMDACNLHVLLFFLEQVKYLLCTSVEVQKIMYM
jgi:hypothetical protein